MKDGWYRCPIHNVSFQTKPAREHKDADEDGFAIIPPRSGPWI
jgi:hypothetical protein